MEHEQAVHNLAVECYLLGEMTPAERDAFEEHYFECPVCAEDLRAGSQFIDDAKEIWRTEPRPARVIEQKPERSSWLDWLRPQVAAPALASLLVLAGAGAFMTLSLRQQLDQATAPRRVESTSLRPVTRGETTLVSVREGDPVVLQFDLPQASASDLHFVVKSTDNSVVLQFNGDPPEPGQPVTLSIPRFDLPPGRYTLEVEPLAASAGGTVEIAQYPLEVRRP